MLQFRDVYSLSKHLIAFPCGNAIRFIHRFASKT